MLKLTPAIAVLFASALCAQIKVTQHSDRISVEIDGQPYTDFFLPPDGNKPYILPIRTASGIIVTRPYPLDGVKGEDTDHPYHHGIFFAHGDINGTEFWATEPGSKSLHQGRMRLQKVMELRSGERAAVVKLAFDGLDWQGKPILSDVRTVTFRAEPALRIIDYEVEIKPLDGPITFKDTKEGTFGIRLASALAEDHGGRMVNAEGRETEKNVWGKRSSWVDYYGKINGETVGVAIFDHRSNPRHPTYWMSRAYGLFAANIFGLHDFTGDKSKDGSMTIPPGDTLRFRYRVVIHSGDVHSANIASLYAQFTARNQTH